MKLERLVPYIVFVCIACLIGFYTWNILSRAKEGFQTAPATTSTNTPTSTLVNSPADTKKAFWEAINVANDDRSFEYMGVLDKIKRIAEPIEGDPFQVTFPKYISAYAMAKYKEDRVRARNALLNDYDTHMRELTTLVYDQNVVAAWNTDPKTQSCVAIDVVRTNFLASLAKLKTNMSALDQQAGTIGRMRDENMEFQLKYQTVCSTKPPSQACIDLASQEPVLFSLLSRYESLNETVFTKEIDVTESILVLGDVFKLLNCEGGDISVDFQRDIGTIDNEALREKLENLSPYYISPDTLKYVTRMIITPEEIASSSVTTNSLFNDMKNTITTIQIITGTTPAVTSTT